MVPFAADKVIEPPLQNPLGPVIEAVGGVAATMFCEAVAVQPEALLTITL